MTEGITVITILLCLLCRPSLFGEYFLFKIKFLAL